MNKNILKLLSTFSLFFIVGCQTSTSTPGSSSSSSEKNF